MSKRILSLVLALVMVLGTMGSLVFAEGTGNEKVDELIELGLVQGYGDGTYGLDKTITRAEVATMLVRALDAENEAKAMANIPSIFTDMSPLHWANGYVNYAVGKGIITGYPDKTFKPNNEITYAEVAKMLVEVLDGLTDAEKANAVWPTTWLAKAVQLGVFDGVNINDYSAKAVREKVFEMVYNVYFTKEVGNNTIVKAIVLENNRVEALGKDEIVIEVIKEVQRANYADASRYEKGDQIRLVVPADVADVEELLGKVADFTITAGNKVRALKVDETYTYVQGPIYEATRNKLNVGGRNYTVELDERYRDRDERIFRTYHNDKDYSYEDFYKDVKAADYARVTVKNGKVLFIDAYTFEDIAPVKEVDEDVVHVYNDERNGAIKKVSIPANTIAVKDGEFSRGAENVKALDVVHLYNGGKGMLVKKDAKIDGTFKKVSFDRKFEDVRVVVDDKEYQVLDAKYMRPVYSLDSEEFHTLYANDADRQLREFKDEEVTILTDINGNLQYITTEVDLGEFVALLSDVLSRDVRVVKSDNSKAEYRVTFDSILEKPESTKQINLNEFSRKELVYMSVDGEEIDILKGVKSASESGEKAEIIERQNYIKIGDDEYKLLDRTNVFIREELRATTIADIVKNYEENSLEAYVVSDKEFNDIVPFAKGLNTDRDDVAHTIVFTKATPKVSYNYRNAEILRIYTSGRDYEVRVKFANDEIETYSVVRGSKAYDNIKDDVVKESDIVKIELTKADEPKLTNIEKVIDKDAPVFEVTDVESYSGYRLLKIEDVNKKEETYFLYNDADVFGYVEEGSKVSFKLAREGKKDIDVMVVRAKNAKVNGVHGKTTVPEPEPEPKKPETYIVEAYKAAFGRLDVEDKYGKKSSLFVEDFDGWVIGEDEVPVEVMLAWLAKNIPNEDSTIIVVVEDNVLKVEGKVTEREAKITGDPILNEDQGGYFVKLQLTPEPISDEGLKVYSVNSKEWLTVHPDSDNILNIWFRVADVDGNKLEDRDGVHEWFVINVEGVFKVTFNYDSEEITIPSTDNEQN